ncbi:uncharacterized protein K441DRAFT_683033 [Cenococcum geophilum 1.58]|uniref:Uncharacterized protein n=1 Tax=Cenococcum geophilum 1.58 TaxID=794803 RepID=A0ACC8EKT5_9PEZI|nr:hypothetical protein K441DRAFT_683033 [Cenococcum geophilum 1.58]
MATITSKHGQGVKATIACASLGTAFAYWVYFDTPRYLYAKDQDAKGDAPLERLYEKSIDEPVVIQAKDILTSLELERTATAGLRIKDFFWDTSNMQAARRIHTGVILVGDAYLMGIDIIFCYTTTIFQAYIGPALPMASGLVGAPIAITDTNVGWKTWIWLLVFNAIAASYRRPTLHSMLSEFTRACLLCPQVFFTDMLVVYYCCPETRGRSLEEIDLIFMSERLQDTAAAKQLEHGLVPEASVGDTESWNEGSVVPEKEI